MGKYFRDIALNVNEVEAMNILHGDGLINQHEELWVTHNNLKNSIANGSEKK